MALMRGISAVRKLSVSRYATSRRYQHRALDWNGLRVHINMPKASEWPVAVQWHTERSLESGRTLLE